MCQRGFLACLSRTNHVLGLLLQRLGAKWRIQKSNLNCTSDICLLFCSQQVLDISFSISAFGSLPCSLQKPQVGHPYPIRWCDTVDRITLHPKSDPLLALIACVCFNFPGAEYISKIYRHTENPEGRKHLAMRTSVQPTRTGRFLCKWLAYSAPNTWAAPSIYLKTCLGDYETYADDTAGPLWYL